MAKGSTRGTESLSRFSGSSLHLESLFGYASLAKLAKIHGLSKKAKIRLEVLDFARNHPVAVSLWRYGIARSTYYRWKRKFNPRNLKSLIPSRRPRKVRKPKWTRELLKRIQELKETYPFLGKEKLTLFRVSSSTVGRILCNPQGGKSPESPGEEECKDQKTLCQEETQGLHPPRTRRPHCH